MAVLKAHQQYKDRARDGKLSHQAVLQLEVEMTSHEDQLVRSQWHTNFEPSFAKWVKEERERFRHCHVVSLQMPDKLRELYGRSALLRVSPAVPQDGPYCHSDLQARLIESIVLQLALQADGVQALRDGLFPVCSEVAPELKRRQLQVRTSNISVASQHSRSHAVPDLDDLDIEVEDAIDDDDLAVVTDKEEIYCSKAKGALQLLAAFLQPKAFHSAHVIHKAASTLTQSAEAHPILVAVLQTKL